MTTTSIHGRFYVLLKQLPYQSKQDLVWNYSNMLTDSLSEFYEKDPSGYRRMISDMQSMVNNMEVPNEKGNDRTIKKLRSGILYRLQKHGVDTTDWDKVNRFMENPRIAGKRLYQMTEDEMRAFIPKMERILQKDAERQEQIDRLTQMN